MRCVTLVKNHREDEMQAVFDTGTTARNVTHCAQGLIEEALFHSAAVRNLCIKLRALFLFTES